MDEEAELPDMNLHLKFPVRVTGSDTRSQNCVMPMLRSIAPTAEKTDPDYRSASFARSTSAIPRRSRGFANNRTRRLREIEAKFRED